MRQHDTRAKGKKRFKANTDGNHDLPIVDGHFTVGKPDPHRLARIDSPLPLPSVEIFGTNFFQAG